MKTVLTHNAIALAAQTNRNMAQHPVIHIHDPLPDNPLDVNPQSISLLQMIIQHRRQQIVGAGHGMNIAGKMQIDILHRNNLRPAAAGCSALHAHTRPH